MSDLDRARALCQVRRYDEALAFARRAVAQDPTDVERHCLLASALYHLDRNTEALRAAESGVAQDPAEEWAHRLRALALLSLGRKRPALAAAEQAVRLAPMAPEAHAALAQAQLANGRRDEAERTAARCVELAPDHALGHNVRAVVLLGTKRWRDAELACRQALAIDPEHAAARHNLGVAVSRQKGREVEGVSHLTEAAKLDPRDRQSRDQAVAVGRRYAAGGMFAAYVVFRILTVTGRRSDRPELAAGVVLVAFALVAVALLVRQRRRLAELPPGVAELIRRERWRVGPRAGKVFLGACVVLGVASAGVMVVQPVAGGFLLAVCALLGGVTWLLARRGR